MKDRVSIFAIRAGFPLKANGSWNGMIGMLQGIKQYKWIEIFFGTIFMQFSNSKFNDLSCDLNIIHINSERGS